jgi:hypothetical protein
VLNLWFKKPCSFISVQISVKEMVSHGNMAIFASGSDNITDKYHNFNLWLETASLYIALL